MIEDISNQKTEKRYENILYVYEMVRTGKLSAEKAAEYLKKQDKNNNSLLKTLAKALGN